MFLLGSSEYGGFGGIGVENWILQNGGSFKKAMETFLYSSFKARSFNEFKDIYPIYDFGQNHKNKSNRHDNYINGVSEQGYDRMKERFVELIKDLEEFEVSMDELSKNAVRQGITTLEFNEAAKNMSINDFVRGDN